MTLSGDGAAGTADGGLGGVLEALSPYARSLVFAAGDRIFEEGAASESFYIIDEGEVRIEVHADGVDADNVLAYSGPGSFLGEVGVLGAVPRSASAVALTEVRMRGFSKESLDRLAEQDPAAAVSVVWALGRDVAAKLLRSSERVAEHLAGAGRDPVVDGLVAAAVAAQHEFESWTEPAVDALLADIALVVSEHADQLAATALGETGIGNVTDKAVKIRFGSLGVQAAMAGKVGYGPTQGRRDPLRDQHIGVRTSAGVLFRLLVDRPSMARRLPELVGRPGGKVQEFVSPVGVVFALVPLTEPVATFIDSVLITLKGRNSVILSSHRSAQGVTDETGLLVQEVLARHGAPLHLVQWVRGRTSRQTTSRFMSHPDVALILATGGAAMVKAAYSSGTPAIGVGPGNAPAWIAPDADLPAAAYCVVESKSFDYGLVCGSEQHLVVDRTVMLQFETCLAEHGAYILDPDQTERFMAAAFDPVTAGLRLPLVGQAATVIAERVGIDVPRDTRLLVFRADGGEPHGAAARERLAPIVSLFEVDGDDAAIELCQRILDYEGAGHTAVVHTRDGERATRFAERVRASRILVNTPATQGCCGVMTGLFPSLILGCGTFGGNSTTDNVGFSNLVNIKRMASIEFTNPAMLATFRPSTLAQRLSEMPAPGQKQLR